MRDDPLKKCPQCGKAGLKRLVGVGAGLIFKGSGFYITDYKNKGAGSKEGGEAKPAESKPAEAKPAAEAKPSSSGSSTSSSPSSPATPKSDSPKK